MKKILSIALSVLFLAGAAYAQQPTQQKSSKAPAQHRQHQHGNCPHKHANCPHQKAKANVNANGIAMEIVRAFPKVKSVKKAGKWNEVYDANKNLLGYALYSKPSSNGIKGYNGETPLLIAFDTKQKITSVEILANNETPQYLTMVKNSGLLKQWNGLSIKKAKKKKVDTVSGATYTSKSVIASLQAALNSL